MSHENGPSKIRWLVLLRNTEATDQYSWYASVLFTF